MTLGHLLPRLAAVALPLLAAEAVAAQSAGDKLDLRVPPGLFAAEEAVDARREADGEPAVPKDAAPASDAGGSGFRLDTVDQPDSTRWGGGAPEDPIGLRLGLEVPLDEVQVKRQR